MDRALLVSVLARLDESRLAVGDAAPIAVGLVPTDSSGGIDLRIRPLDPRDPVRSLFGFKCPPDWAGFGMATTGRARHLDEPGAATQEVRLGYLVARSGQQAALLYRGDASEPAMTDLGEGRLPDSCRRVLGLATPPPLGHPGALCELLWVERLLAASVADPGRLSWSDAMHAHPAAHRPPGGGRAGSCTTPERFAERVSAICRDMGWHGLRQLACADDLAGSPIPQGLAAWMDDGMFSREALGSLPSMSEMVADLEAVARPEVVCGVANALRVWATV